MEGRCDECGSVISCREMGCPRCLLGLGLTSPSRAGGAVDGEGEPGGQGAVGRIGVYELLEVLGKGGTGTVFLARQPGTAREVAVKVLALRAEDADRAMDRFRVEAAALGRLRHPGIVTVHEAGVDAGRPYLVMERVRGGTVLEHVDGQPLMPMEAARWVLSVGEAVAHAHEAGVWHRDLKPGNVLVDERGCLRLTDFGLAQLAGGWGEVGGGARRMGTPGHLAPEQIRPGGYEEGPWTDVHGLGGLLFHLLTGRPMFVAATVAETLRQRLECEVASPRVLNPAVPRDLEAVCLKCVARDPARRYAAVAELNAELRRYLEGRPVLARPVGVGERLVRWARRNPGLAGVGLLAGLLVTGWMGTASVLWRRASGEAWQAKLALGRLETARIGERLTDGHRNAALRLLAGQIAVAPEDPLVAARIRMSVARAPWAFPSAREGGGEGVERRTRERAGEVGPGESLDEGEQVTARCRHRSGRWEAVGTSFGRVRIAGGGVEGKPGPWMGHEQQVTDVDFVGDAGLLVSSARDGTVHLWDGTTGELLKSAPRMSSWAMAVAVRGDGRQVAYGGANGEVWVWEPWGEGNRVGWAHAQAVLGLEYSADGTQVLSWSQDGRLHVVRNGLVEHGGLLAGGVPVSAGFWSEGNGVWVAVAGGGRRSWELVPAVAVERRWPLGEMLSADWVGGAGRVMGFGGDGVVRFWNMETGLLEMETAALPCPLVWASVSSDARHVLVTGRDRVHRCWDLDQGTMEEWMPAVRRGPWRTVADGQRNRFAVLGWDGDVHLRGVGPGRSGDRVLRMGAPVASGAFDPSGRWFVGGTRGGGVQLWDLGAGTCGWVAGLTGETVVEVGFSADGEEVWVSTLEGRLAWLGVMSGAVRWEVRIPAGGGVSAHDPVSRRVASVVDGVRARVWDPTGRAGSPVEFWHPSRVCSVALQEGTGLLAVGLEDGCVWLWDTERGAVLGEPFRVGGRVGRLVFSRDGRNLLVGGPDSVTVFGVEGEFGPAPGWVAGFVAWLGGDGVVHESVEEWRERLGGERDGEWVRWARQVLGDGQRR